jgi:hypothetical protein
MIIYCCSDLIFATKIRSTAQAVGVGCRPVRNVAMLQARLDQIDDGKLNEPVTGVLVDLDMQEAALEVIKHVKTEQPGVQTIAFGAHVATQVLALAQESGADQVLPRSQFAANLPALLEEYGGSEL